MEKKKAESLLMDNEKKREKSRRDVGRLENDLTSLTKELQTLATPSKLVVSLVVMAVMFVINRRQGRDILQKRGLCIKTNHEASSREVIAWVFYVAAL